jgi:hypothetical protein
MSTTDKIIAILTLLLISATISGAATIKETVTVVATLSSHYSNDWTIGGTSYLSRSRLSCYDGFSAPSTNTATVQRAF